MCQLKSMQAPSHAKQQVGKRKKNLNGQKNKIKQMRNARTVAYIILSIDFPFRVYNCAYTEKRNVGCEKIIDTLVKNVNECAKNRKKQKVYSSPVKVGTCTVSSANERWK